MDVHLEVLDQTPLAQYLANWPREILRLVQHSNNTAEVHDLPNLDIVSC